MGQAGVDLPDPLETRPSPGRHGPVAGSGAPAHSADPGSLDDAGADDLLSQLAGEEIDRLLAAADVESESSNAEPAPSSPTLAPREPSPTPAASNAIRRAPTPAQQAANRSANADGARHEAGPRARPTPLSPGAHNVIAPPDDESDLAVQAELDDAFEQVAGYAGDAGDGLPAFDYLPQLSPQGAELPREPQGLHGQAPFTPSHEEPLGELLEQLTAARAEVAAEARAEAAAEARYAEADDEAFPPPAARLGEDEDEPLNLVVPGSGAPGSLRSAALVSEEPLGSGEAFEDLGEPTSPHERAGLDLAETEPEPAAREPDPVRPAVPIPLDEDSFLAEEPSPADESDRTPLPVRVLEWVNKPLAGLPEAVRQAMGKVAILTLINAILVLVYVLLVRSR